MASKHAEAALKTRFDSVNGSWAMCFNCKKGHLSKGEIEVCANCNFSLVDSLIEWKKELVRICKQEDDEIAAAEAAEIAKNAKKTGDAAWPRTATDAGVSKTIYEVFVTMHRHKAELTQWDEDKYGTILDAMMEMNEFYNWIGDKKKKPIFLEHLRGKTCHDIYKGMVHLLTLKETIKDDAEIVAPV